MQMSGPGVITRLVSVGMMLGIAAAPLGQCEVTRLRPYDPDAHTLHLWHLDEARPPFADRGNAGVPLRGLLNGAKAGIPSLQGLGSAVSFHANAGGTPGASDLRGAILSASPILITGPGDNVDKRFRYAGADGAFTYEMMVKLDIMPKDARCIALGLMSMEGDDKDRIFNFRIEREGFLSFFPLPHGGATGGAIASIPFSGPHAMTTGKWYHVAVAYDGNAGRPGNLKLYWTAIDAARDQAHLIGSGSLTGDFNGINGDFAIGNEARSFGHNAEGEPFPGVIDEVRISGIARHPADYHFVPPGRRVTAETASAAVGSKKTAPEIRLELANVLIDSKPVERSRLLAGTLELKSGLHRLDFDFGFAPDQPDGAAGLQCLLEGVDERWRETERGMTLACQFLDASGVVVSQSRFQAAGLSDGWETGLEHSTLTRRSEPVFIPPGSAVMRVSISSGSPETTGFLAIDDIILHPPGAMERPVWSGGRHRYDALTTSPGGSLPGWRRGGSEPAIARLVIRPNYPALGLVDGDQTRDGEWEMMTELPAAARGGGVFVFSWSEVFNIIDGGTRRATYVNVPPGRYRFRAMGLSDRTGDALDLAILIQPPFWKRAWFWPVVSPSVMTLIAAGIFICHRARARRILERLRFQNALEKDRTRIARDMHDDLGTRITFINMSAALAGREIDRSPDDARRHLAKMTESARELVVAMDDLVWAVDPAHDTLDELATHLTRLAEEMFRDSDIRCRLEIPPLLPAIPLGSEFRHQVALAYKEALHNVLRHAGTCEVFVALHFDGERLKITIRDTGRGFDGIENSHRHGLGNIKRRVSDIGGVCSIISTPGGGTTIIFDCPVSRQI